MDVLIRFYMNYDMNELVCGLINDNQMSWCGHCEPVHADMIPLNLIEQKKRLIQSTSR